MCAVTSPARLTLPPDRRAPGRAREFLREVRCPAHGARVRDSSELLVSEVVTNAVSHGTPPVSMRVECDGSAGLRVSVTDGSPGRPVVHHADPDEESGRGVELVGLLSDAWGVQPADDGKTVWFVLNA